MGIFIMILGVVSIIIGIACMATLVGTLSGVGFIIGGIVYIMVGWNHREIVKMRSKLPK